MIKYCILRNILFLLVFFELSSTSQAFAKMASIDVNYGDGWQTITYTGTTGNGNADATRNHISKVDETFVEFSHGSNGNIMLTPVSNEQQNNICEATDNVKSNVALSVDLSESSNIVLIGLGIALGILVKWRKSLNTSRA